MHVIVTEEEGRGLRNPYQVLRPTRHNAAIVKGVKNEDPMKWLERNSGDKWAESGKGLLGKGLGLKGMVPPTLAKMAPTLATRGKPKAALISLVRNSELEGIVQSMSQLEWRWNRKYHYPWVFFNDEEFSEEFKVRTSFFSTKIFHSPSLGIIAKACNHSSDGHNHCPTG